MTDSLIVLPLVVAALAAAAAGLWVRAGRAVAFRWAAPAFALAVGAHILYAGWLSAAQSGGVALALFAVLFFTGLLSRSATYATPVLLAVLPFALWWAFLPGLALMVGVSLWRLLRTLGRAGTKAFALDAVLTTSRIDPESMTEMAATYAADTAAPKVDYFLLLAAGFALGTGALLLLG